MSYLGLALALALLTIGHRGNAQNGSITIPAGGGASSCTLDPKCFRYSQGCGIVGNCKPYRSSTTASCEECINSCLGGGADAGGCRSVVFDLNGKTCSFYNVDAGPGLQRLGKMPGFMYFQPTGVCQGTVPTVGPTPTDCPAGQSARMIYTTDYQMPGFTGTTVAATSRDACIDACLANQSPSGGALGCKTAQFGPNNQCTLSGSDQKAEGGVQPAPGITYLRKRCFPAGSVVNCPKGFEEDPQMITVGFSREIVDATSSETCIQQCLDANTRFGFTCLSAMYFYGDSTQNCIINSESKSTRPDVFTHIDDQPVMYLEPGCAGANLLGNSLRDSVNDKVEEKKWRNQWTHWSSCDSTTSQQVRYRRCKKADMRKCMKQHRKCEVDLLNKPLDILGPGPSEFVPVSVQEHEHEENAKQIDDRLIDSNNIRRDAVAVGMAIPVSKQKLRR